MALTMVISLSSTAQTTIELDTEASSLKWRGSKLFGFGEHYGTLDFDLGQAIMDGGDLIGGTFIVDMRTMKNTDGDYSENLIRHLSNEDFFDVETYPTASLVITSIEFYPPGEPMGVVNKLRATADLTIMGTTKDISFDGTLNSDRTELSTQFIIDRTRWGIMYGSQKVIKIQDHILSDAIEFDARVVFESAI